MFRFLAATLSILAGGSAALAGDAVFPPGSRIGLVPPADMEAAHGIAGFRSMRTGAAIVTIEMPAEAYPSLAAGFTDEALKAQGFTVKLRENPVVEGIKAILVTGEQSQGSRMVPKSVLLAANPTMTAMVIGQLPQGASAQEVQSVEEALKTVAFRAPLGMDELLAALPFRIGDTAGFRPIRAMAGNSLLLTDGPKDAAPGAAQPMLIVARSFGPAPSVEQREVFARQALVANTFLKEVVMERAQSFRQSGSDWHEIVAKAKDAQSGTPVVVQQTIRFEPDGYVRAVGVVREDARDRILPRFRRIADSVTTD